MGPSPRGATDAICTTKLQPKTWLERETIFFKKSLILSKISQVANMRSLDKRLYGLFQRLCNIFFAGLMTASLHGPFFLSFKIPWDAQQSCQSRINQLIRGLVSKIANFPHHSWLNIATKENFFNAELLCAILHYITHKSRKNFRLLFWQPWISCCKKEGQQRLPPEIRSARQSSHFRIVTLYKKPKSLSWRCLSSFWHQNERD